MCTYYIHHGLPCQRARDCELLSSRSPSKLAMSEYLFLNDEDFLLDSMRAVNYILGETNHSVCDSLLKICLSFEFQNF
jgi:hypothetical protein